MSITSSVPSGLQKNRRRRRRTTQAPSCSCGRGRWRRAATSPSPLPIASSTTKDNLSAAPRLRHKYAAARRASSTKPFGRKSANVWLTYPSLHIHRWAIGCPCRRTMSRSQLASRHDEGRPHDDVELDQLSAPRLGHPGGARASMCVACVRYGSLACL